MKVLYSTVFVFTSLAGALLPAPLGSAAQDTRNYPKPPAPRYYRTMVGSIEVINLTDGSFSFEASKIMTGISTAEIARDLSESFLQDPYPMEVNTFLINTGKKLILVDTGIGDLPEQIPALEKTFGTTGYGKLLENLRAAGYEPSQIDEVYLTHLHADHIGGLTKSGKIAFPRAIVRLDQREAAFWLNPLQRAKFPKMDALFKAARFELAPYMKAHKMKTFDGDTTLTTGIRSSVRPGHTPGHSTYLIESNGQMLLLWGDLIHVPPIQFSNPAVGNNYDLDSLSATKEREEVFAEAAKRHYLVGGAHLFFPALGHLRATGKGYSFVPLAFPATM